MTNWRTSVAVPVAIALAMVSDVSVGATNCNLVQIAELPVRLAHNKLIIDGAINGQRVGIMVDTGSNVTLIARSAAMRLGLGRQEVRGYRMFGVGGETHVEGAFIDEFRLGQATRKGFRMLVAGEHDPGDDVAVILGEDFLHNVDVEFDLAHHTVRLYQPKDCDGVSLAYWTTSGAGEVAIEAIYDASPQIILTAKVNGQPVRTMLDSGAGSSVLDKTDAARAGVTPETAGVVAVGSGTGMGGKSVDYWIGEFESFVIGDETVSNPRIAFGDLWKGAAYRAGGLVPAMLLGADFLHAHRVLVAHSQRKIYFTYIGGTVFRRAGPPEPRSDRGPEGSLEPEKSKK